VFVRAAASKAVNAGMIRPQGRQPHKADRALIQISCPHSGFRATALPPTVPRPSTVHTRSAPVCRAPVIVATLRASRRLPRAGLALSPRPLNRLADN